MLIPDHETEVDYLNCESIAQTVVELLTTNQSHPLTVGIHGDWGAGKSSILKMIESDLGDDKGIAVLWFNGWAFEGFDDAKMVLIEAIITELCRNRSLTGKAKKLATKLLRRVDWLKAAKHGGNIAWNIMSGLPSPNQIAAGHDAILALKDGDNGIADMKEQLGIIGGLLKPADDSDSLPETIHAFREEFQELLKEAKIDQLVVLIDDLDRCLPNTAIQTLEAIRLFLFVPGTAFVVGADEAMIEYAVKQHFPDLPVASGPLPYSRNYLEKLIQVPFRIPALGTHETRTYVTLLLVQNLVGESHSGFVELLDKARKDLQRPWIATGLSQTDVEEVDSTKSGELGKAFILAQQISPVLAEGTKGNPRQIKRFLNALFLRQAIAKARGFHDDISQPVLAKLMLAERFQPDFYQHVSNQSMASSDGFSASLRHIEAHDNDAGKGSSADADSDKDAENKWLDREWLLRWVKIKPPIGDVDLRPYVFVARDRRVLVSATEVGGLEALVQQLCGSRLAIAAIEPEVKALNQADAETVFIGLRDRVLSVGSFENQPAGVDGLLVVAKHHPEMQIQLVRLIGSLDVSRIGHWAVKGWGEITESTARDELNTVMNSWANQTENPTLRTATQTTIAALRDTRR